MGQEPLVAAPLDFQNPALIKLWLDRIETVVDDAMGAAEDQNRPLQKRDMGPVQVRRILAEARTSLAKLLKAARRALPPE